MKQPNILISSLVRDRDWILPDFLNCIKNLNYRKAHLDLLFIVNDSTDSSLDILLEFKDDNTSFRDITILEKNYGHKEDKRGRSRRHVYSVLADLRNMMVDKFLESDCTHLLQIDSDILCNPDLLTELLDLQTDAAAAVIFNDYGRGNIGNVLNFKHIDPVSIKHIILPEQPDIFECDISGACALYTKELLEQGFKYLDSPDGEDTMFCLQLHKARIKFKCRKGLATHCMKEEELIKWKMS